MREKSRRLPIKLVITSITLLISFVFVTTLIAKQGSATSVLITQINQYVGSTWNRIADIFRRRRRDGGTQGDEFCSISPDITSYISWSDRPIFVWEGTATKIILSSPNSEWVHPITPEEQRQQIVIYNGAPLQPGQEYTYLIDYETRGRSGQPFIEQKKLKFKVMDAEKRRVIQAELPSENLPLERAIYFANKDLFLDVVREVFSPSSFNSWDKKRQEEWNKKVQEIRTEFCQ